MMTAKQTRGTSATRQQVSKPTGRFEFNPEALSSRIEDEKGFYIAAIESPHRLGEGAISEFVFPSTAAAAEEYHRLRTAGYQPLDPISPIAGFEVFNGIVRFYLAKPESMQAADLAVIAEEAEATYRQGLEADYQAEVERVTEQLVAQANRKREAEQIAAEEAERNAIRAEVSAALAGGK